ncbi:MAG: UDP-N-acetylmuramoyl-L-alanine--D-glutamate ligase [Candidatus Pacebacteria bacterium]|nr:UDP-N-acetylmuramoyl-L-alanine--D-glutamate ligase [Candidatus Paceibacterota bacterium]
MSIINLKNLKNKNIHIVGIGGAEGSAIAEFLVANGISSITGHDFSSKADFKKAFYNTHLSLKLKEREKALNHLLNLPIRINFKDHYLEGVEDADMVFVSQVWFKYPQNMPILEKLKDSGVPFKTITNLYFELAPCKIISVTGTNGKTTTARLINSIFEIWAEKNNKSKIYFAGNDRQNVQVLDKLNKMKKDDILILETSSTQLLLNFGISPHIGVITNITPNHIDDHGSFENYIEAKKNLIRYQGKGDFAILNYDDEQSKKIVNELRITNYESGIFLFSWKEELKEGCFVKNDEVIIRKNNKEIKLFSVDNIKIPGKHNLENVLAAVSVAYLYGIDPEIIKNGISEYTGTKHRLKLLYNIGGVKYYDDTQATTPEAVIAGIESFDNDIILLAGGDNKGMKYEKLAEKINDKIKLLILFPGDASDEIEKFIDKSKIDFVKVKNFQEAVKILKKYYKKILHLASPKRGGITVLISPGAAHFYSKYVESSGKSLKEWIRLVSSIK